MSHTDRLAGLVRSLAIYHGIPLRQRRLRRLYAQFVAPGDLVFDIGAHAGNRARALAALGCRVVAFEPQPDFARLLRLLFARSPRVQVVEAAVTDHNGRVRLAVSERTPTVTTLADDWQHTRRQEPGFAGVAWNRDVEVEAVTLDTLIERLGEPSFVKLDVEGAEPRILAGLHRALPALSFEYLPTALEHVAVCLDRLDRLGAYRYNVSIGESYRLASPDWHTAPEVMAMLATPAAQRRAGDVYARRQHAR